MTVCKPKEFFYGIMAYRDTIWDTTFIVLGGIKMKKHVLNEKVLEKFRNHLILEEKSEATIEKYLRDVRTFMTFVGNRVITKNVVIAYKEKLQEDSYAVRSINSMLASINSLFTFLEWYELRVKSIRIQQQVFCSVDRELTREEYERLVKTAYEKRKKRLALILQTICGTGIRISELKYITVEAVRRGETVVLCKGKTRSIFLVRELQKKLLEYIEEQGVKGGSIFITKSGNPITRTNVWRDMKALCKKANVNPRKVFPHNLRHLFARVFYGLDKDIAKLSDVLGHTSINTTRIYIMSTGIEHRRCMEKMRLVI